MLFVVLPLAVVFSTLAVAAFSWATRSGQLDDLETPPLRMLTDEARPEPRDAAPAPPDVSSEEP
ncbi:MAG TPA: cbb3-type cytochrome oxidase assembly protein CcoS [Polyangiaceae bacterium]